MMFINCMRYGYLKILFIHVLNQVHILQICILLYFKKPIFPFYILYYSKNLEGIYIYIFKEKGWIQKMNYNFYQENQNMSTRHYILIWKKLYNHHNSNGDWAYLQRMQKKMAISIKEQCNYCDRNNHRKNMNITNREKLNQIKV